MDILFYTGILILVGLIFGKLAKMVKLPNVTGYLVGGLLVGPSVLNLIPENFISTLNIVNNVALGFIAFTIGNEFKISYLKKVGMKPMIIAIFEALFGVLFVLFALMIYKWIFGANYNFAFVLILSAIAAATAPAATMMVIRQYKAEGKVTETLMSVVALDDLVAIILFGIHVAVAKAVTSTQDVSVAWSLLKPVVEIVASLSIGGVMGFLLTLSNKWFTGRGNRISLVVMAIFIVTSVTLRFDLSNLMAIMAMGAVYTNLSKASDQVNDLIYFVTPPIYILFFVLSGVELELKVLLTVGIAGIIYVVFRVMGKILGAAFGGAITKAEPRVRKYLGWALVPQAGVAIGLSLLAQQIVPEYAQEVRAIVLAATLIYELIGPVATKLSLEKAGEIKTNK